MTRETKVGLLVGMGVILLVGIILSDLLSAHKRSPTMTEFAHTEQNNLDGHGSGATDASAPRDNTPVTPPVSPMPITYVPTPEDLAHPPVAPVVPGAPGAKLQDAVTIDRGVTAPAQTYYVQPHDDFDSIALHFYGDKSYASLIKMANPAALGRDGKLRVAAMLTIPAKPATTTTMISDPIPSHPVAADPGHGPLPINPVPDSAAGKTIKVESGDTLSSLAGKYLGSSNKFMDLFKANTDKLHTPNDTLHIGMTLKLPAAATPTHVASDSTTGGGSIFDHGSATPGSGESVRTGGAAPAPSSGAPATPSTGGSKYVFQSGDTLYAVAAAKMGNGGLWKKLQTANHIDDPNDIPVGTVILIPQH